MSGGNTEVYTSFTVDVTPLKHPSGRPHHLEERLGSKKRMRRNDFESVLAKRQAILDAKSEKVARHMKHAKKIAKTISLRKAESMETIRRKLHDRQSLIDIRRKIMLRFPRSQHMDEGRAEMIRMMICSKRIQRWWKRLMIVRSIAHIKNLPQCFESFSFDEAVNYIQDQKIIQSVSVFFKRISISSDENVAKTFLGAFLINFFPDEILGNQKEEEKIVAEKANQLIRSFKIIVSTSHVTKDFQKDWEFYNKVFKVWKSRDNELLVESMVEHYMQLEKLWHSVKENVDAEHEWRPKIEKHQKLIRAKIMRISGKPAIDRLTETVKKFRDVNSDNISRLPAKESHSNSVVNSSYEIREQQQPHDSGNLESLQPDFESIASNEYLAHELIMNPDFEIQSESSSMQSQVAEIAKKAFFDKLREEINHGKNDWVPTVLANMRQMLLEMVPEKSSAHRKIAEGLDMTLIEQQFEQGVLDVKTILEFICETMLSLCAPIRDAEIRAIMSIEDLIGAIQSIFRVLEKMKLDLANFRMRQLRPYLMQHAVDYERSKFKQALEQGRVSLKFTRDWIFKSAKKASEIAAARNPEKIAVPENGIKFENLYFDALLSLIFSSELLGVRQIAETLKMDIDRLAGFQNEVQAIAVVASLLMLSRNTCQDFRENKAAVRKLKENLFMYLQERETTIDNISHLINSSVDEVLDLSGKSLNGEQREMIKNMVDKTMSFKDTVYSLLSRRMMNEIRVHLMSGRFRKDSNNGLDVVNEELEALSNSIFRFASHNRQVYSEWYDLLIREALNA